MHCRRFALPVAVVIALAAFPPAHAATLTVGTNLGLNVVTPKNGGDSQLTVGVPGSVGQLVPGFQPGFRIGVIATGGAHEVFFEPGLYILHVSSQTLTQFEGTVNYQYNVSSQGSNSAYCTAGVGLIHESFGSDSFFGEADLTNAILGGGLGVRHRVHHGHGAGRAEMRFDYITEDKTGFEGGTVFSVKFGFDLFLD